VSSGMGIVALPLIGFNCASKWAIVALHESLAREVKGFSIKVTLLEPSACAADFLNPLWMGIATGTDAFAIPKRHQRPPPCLDADDPPLRFAVSAGILPTARAAYADRMATWNAWEAMWNAAQGERAENAMSSF
jgi:NAD(P)-dependent dehydrogenase (short-subunit alcohol dehydrogenase family)